MASMRCVVVCALLDRMGLPAETLSLDELADLGAFLQSDGRPEDCMDLSSLHGFLTALAIGPADVLPSEWLRLIWGHGHGPIFRSMKEQKRIVGLVLRFCSDIQLDFAFDVDPEYFGYEPLFTHYPREGSEPYISGDEWCAGFCRGLRLRDKDWQPLCNDKEHADLLLKPIFWFTDEKIREETCAGRDPETVRQEMLRAIAPSVKAIDRYWKARDEKTRKELVDQFGSELYQILYRHTQPGKDRRKAVAKFERELRRAYGFSPQAGPPAPRPPEPATESRPAPEAASSDKEQHRKFLEETIGVLLKAVEATTPPALKGKLSRQGAPATSRRRIPSKTHFAADDPCPCGSGKKIKECCRFVN